MARPKLLDLFCGAGGAAMGYHRAGFDVTGVDIRPQPRYPFPFVQADAMTYPLDGYDAIHASPPCQVFSDAGTTRKADHPDLLTPTRARLEASGLAYVIENIPLAPMPTGVLLCGATFGLPIVRHRRFEIHPDPVLVPSVCHQTRHGHAVDHGPRFYPYAQGNWEAAWKEHVLPVVWPWMTLAEAGQAIPPAYTEYIGGQLLGEFPAQEPAGRGSGGLT
jgi:DNA (cytosine-5)-methyltransferase 1